MIGRSLLLLTSLTLASAPALAGDKPRLAPGGIDVTADMLRPEQRDALMSASGLSLGTVVRPASEGGREGLAVGGFAAYSADAVNLSSSVRGDGGLLSADVTAAYDAGTHSVAALSLGYDRFRAPGFSLNPSSAGVPGGEARTADDLSLSLSWRQALTPNLSLGGFASAIRSEDGTDEEAARIFRLGAGLGYKF